MSPGASLAMQFVLIGVGGAIGAWLRWAVGLAALKHLGSGFPWGTVAVNLAGSLAAGLVLALLEDRGHLGAYARAFLLVGVLGGFTTYSAMMVDALLLARGVRPSLAGAYLALTLVGGLAAVWFGWWAGRALRAIA
jgi:CrcB protein